MVAKERLGFNATTGEITQGLFIGNNFDKSLFKFSVDEKAFIYDIGEIGSNSSIIKLSKTGGNRSKWRRC